MNKIKPIKIKFSYFDDSDNERVSDAVYFKIFDLALRNIVDKKGKTNIIKLNNENGNN